ncbi:ATP-binding protein [Megalodesulfovibrio gigas]|uniref:Putative sigma factor serine-protein kinase family protein n=1 Tax=Megalodesulfovibrio gigas (strain ATCC 19364 / DSM 1382 / NCIMB 9332 / VKM B-1759) TaxID=1121448 RepID=T2GDJ4_MEGG1|nr:ATP-binding protein [Megalodesulfovibrio gigas]AGW14640.1 putative sigma factor serine-protein kinase family protein [Megalodesulfovibrio gigas DSM 1382 = ATCC 19364]
MSASIERPASLDCIEEFKAFLKSEAVAGGVPEIEMGRVALALEEVLTNIVYYAYPKAEGRINPRHTIQLACKASDGQLLMRIVDRGKPFNVLASSSGGLDMLGGGGMGIYLVRKIMDKVQYERIGDFNVLRLLYKSKAAR